MCDHKWRFSNAYNCFYCIYCFIKDWGDSDEM